MNTQTHPSELDEFDQGWLAAMENTPLARLILGLTGLTQTYDPLDRLATQTVDAGGPDEETTLFTYLGLTEQVLTEQVGGQVTTSYQHDADGRLLAQTKHDPNGTDPDEDSFYGYNPHGDVAGITDETGDARATYGYTAYGSDDESLFTGVDRPDPGDPEDQEPYNVYRYAGKRFDHGTGTYDMGFRDYDPGLNRFLTRDMFNGALADLHLGSNPWTMSRYTFAGGNPTTLIEYDGHVAILPDGGSADVASQPVYDPWASKTLIDGYVLPTGAPPMDPFLEAYEVAKAELEAHYNDQTADALRWAQYACQYLMPQMAHQSHQCSNEFEEALARDLDAYDLGGILPSYIGGEITYYAEREHDWQTEEYRMWADYESASGFRKLELARQLRTRGIYHKPEGPDDLPWSPGGMGLYCVSTIYTAGTFVLAAGTGYGAVKAGIAGGGVAAAAAAGGTALAVLAGGACVAGAANYTFGGAR